MISKKFPLNKTEKRKYLMPEDRDYEILAKAKQLEKLKLTKDEMFLVKFIKTQLERDWRKYLIQELDRLLKKHDIHK